MLQVTKHKNKSVTDFIYICNTANLIPFLNFYLAQLCWFGLHRNHCHTAHFKTKYWDSLTEMLPFHCQLLCFVVKSNKSHRCYTLRKTQYSKWSSFSTSRVRVWTKGSGCRVSVLQTLKAHVEKFNGINVTWKHKKRISAAAVLHQEMGFWRCNFICSMWSLWRCVFRVCCRGARMRE